MTAFYVTALIVLWAAQAALITKGIMFLECEDELTGGMLAAGVTIAALPFFGQVCSLIVLAVMFWTGLAPACQWMIQFPERRQFRAEMREARVIDRKNRIARLERELFPDASWRQP